MRINRDTALDQDHSRFIDAVINLIENRGGVAHIVELYGELRDQLSPRPESFQALQQLLRRHCHQCAEFSSGPALFITRAGSGFWGLNPAEVASRRHGSGQLLRDARSLSPA